MLPMENDNEINRVIIEWLKKCDSYTHKDKNKTALADYVGVTRQAAGRWFKTGKVSKDNLLKASRFYGVPMPDIFGINDRMELRRNSQIEHNAEQLNKIDDWDSNTELDNEEVEVPFFREVELSAGGGRTEVIQNHGPKIRLSKSTLRRKGVIPDNAYCVTVSGTSMEPRIPNGATVGIDTGATQIIDGLTYAIDHDGMLRVKNLYRLPGGGLRIGSFNTDDYPDEILTAAEFAEIRILGKVFWVSFLW